HTRHHRHVRARIGRAVGVGPRRPGREPLGRPVRRERRPALAPLRGPARRVGPRRDRARRDRLDPADPGGDPMTAPTTRAPDPARGLPGPGEGPLRTGTPGELLRTHTAPDGGELTLRVLDPDADLDVLHAWVSRPWARFWGLGGLTRSALRDLYAHVGSLPTHHAFLVRWDAEPVALLQTYEPAHDPVADAYVVRPGDVGAHFLLGGRGPRGTRLWDALGPLVVG